MNPLRCETAERLSCPLLKKGDRGQLSSQLSRESGDKSGTGRDKSGPLPCCSYPNVLEQGGGDNFFFHLRLGTSCPRPWGHVKRSRKGPRKSHRQSGFHPHQEIGKTASKYRISSPMLKASLYMGKTTFAAGLNLSVFLSVGGKYGNLYC